MAKGAKGAKSVTTGTPALRLALDPAADRLLSRDPFALVVGMLLDQQFPMERAFGGPYLIATRMGDPSRLDPAAVAAYDPEEFGRIMAGPPAVHRYHGSMGKRVQQLAAVVVERYGGDVTALWSGAGTGEEVRRRLAELPGFGLQKARIFTALLGKQLGVRPPGWREAAGPYGADGTSLSVADVTGPESLAAVRETKRIAKANAKAAASG